MISYHDFVVISVSIIAICFGIWAHITDKKQKDMIKFPVYFDEDIIFESVDSMTKTRNALREQQRACSATFDKEDQQLLDFCEEILASICETV